MSVASAQATESPWLALATRAREQARRANARAAATPFPHVAERFENEAALNLEFARAWSEFAARERAWRAGRSILRYS